MWRRGGNLTGVTESSELERGACGPSTPGKRKVAATSDATSPLPAVGVFALTCLVFALLAIGLESADTGGNRRMISLGRSFGNFSRLGRVVRRDFRDVALAVEGARGVMGSSGETGVSAVYVTAPSKEVASKLAHGLLETKLCACVNLIPGVESMYWWEGKVETDSEVLMMIKTDSTLVEDLSDWVKKMHPYDVPEVIAVPVTDGLEDYLKWVKASSGP